MEMTTRRFSCQGPDHWQVASLAVDFQSSSSLFYNSFHYFNYSDYSLQVQGLDPSLPWLLTDHPMPAAKSCSITPNTKCTALSCKPCRSSSGSELSHQSFSDSNLSRQQLYSNQSSGGAASRLSNQSQCLPCDRETVCRSTQRIAGITYKECIRARVPAPHGGDSKGLEA